MHVWYGTNEYNFDTLINPPTFDLTYCSQCKKRLFYQTVDIYPFLVDIVAITVQSPIKNEKKLLDLLSKALPRSSRS